MDAIRTRRSVGFRLGLLTAMALAVSTPHAVAEGADGQDPVSDLRQRWESELSQLQSRFGALVPAGAAATGAPMPARAGTVQPGRAASVAPVAGRPRTLSAAQAGALAVGLDDPDDVAGVLDLRQLRHSNTSSEVTYEAQMYDDFGLDYVTDMTWTIDVDGDSASDVCVDVRWVAAKQGLDAIVYGKGCQGAQIGEGSATKAAPATVRVTYPLELLRKSGLSGSSYRYRVQSAFVLGQSNIGGDKAPDDGSFGITHNLAGGASGGSRTTGTTATGSRTTSTGSRTGAATGTTTGAQGGQASGDGSLPSSGMPVSAFTLISMLLLTLGGTMTRVSRRLGHEDGPAWEFAAVPAPARRDHVADRLARCLPALASGRVVLALPPARERPVLCAPGRVYGEGFCSDGAIAMQTFIPKPGSGTPTVSAILGMSIFTEEPKSKYSISIDVSRLALDPSTVDLADAWTVNR